MSDASGASGDIELVQLLTPEGVRVEHPEYSFNGDDDQIKGFYRDMVLTRRVDAEATALQQGGQAADPDGSRARAWQQRLQEAQQLEQTRTNELRYTERLQTQTIVTAARPIVAALYAERGCSVLLDGNTILAANPAMDITPMAVQRLNQALGEVLQEKPVQQLMHDWVLEPQHSQPHELEQLRQADIAKWRPILAASGFVAD